MRTSIIETTVGAAVIVVAALFLWFGYSATSHKPVHGSHTYQALFESVDGIELNSEVRVGGVRVGYVSEISITPDFHIQLSLRIDKTLKIPADSTAAIATSGIIGDRFIEIIPGGEEDFLQENDTFAYTRPGLNLEKLISKLISSLSNKPAS